MRHRLGDRAVCKLCGQDIEFHGSRQWRDRGNGRECLPYVDHKLGEIVRPKGRVHAPVAEDPAAYLAEKQE